MIFTRRETQPRRESTLQSDAIKSGALHANELVGNHDEELPREELGGVVRVN